MKVSVLASGSKGNCTYIEANKKNILIDLGTTCSNIEKMLEEMNIDKIDYIFLTHTHIDHINGLKVFSKKYNSKIYLTEKMYKDLGFSLKNFEFIDNSILIYDINVDIIKTSHDVSDSNGYIFTYDSKSLVYITDTGYINVKNHPMLKDKNIYIIESNHDVEKLMNGKYPYHLKQRILSDKGHLSNKDCSYYLKNFIGKSTHDIILIHLSEENNTEELAYETLSKTLEEINRTGIKITISKQKERTELIEV